MAHTIWRDQEDYIKDGWKGMERLEDQIRQYRTDKPDIAHLMSVRTRPPFKPRVRVKAIYRRIKQ